MPPAGALILPGHKNTEITIEAARRLGPQVLSGVG
jgi:hypothetical protein